MSMGSTTSMVSEGIIKRPRTDLAKPTKPQKDKAALKKSTQITSQTETPLQKTGTSNVEKNISPNTAPITTKTKAQNNIKTPLQSINNTDISTPKVSEEIDEKSLQPYQTQENTSNTALDNTAKQDDMHPSDIEQSPTEAVSYAAEQAIKQQDSQKEDVSEVEQKRYPQIILQGANFKYGSTALTPESSMQLQRITKRLKERASINVEIAGYTDATEDTNAVNQSISQLRSETVKDYFVSNGIEVRRLTAKGYGSKSPIASNTTLQGREQNRRVEIHIQ